MKFRYFSAVVAFSVATVLACAADAPEARISPTLEARNKFANGMANLNSYVEYAVFLNDSGLDEAAFYVFELARRRFGDEDFDKAFLNMKGRRELPSLLTEKEQHKFKACSNEAAREKLSRDVEKSNPAWRRYINYWGLSQKLSGTDIAAKMDAMLAEKELADKFEPVAMAAHVLLKKTDRQVKAAQLYRKLYFNNPHYYDGEYAEFRIKTLDRSNTEQELFSALQQCKGDWVKTITALRDRHPRAAEQGIIVLSGTENPQKAAALLAALESVDFNLQATAAKALSKIDNLSPFAETVRKMANGNDLTLRSLSTFFLHNALGKKEAIELLRKLQNDNCILVRVNADGIMYILSSEQAGVTRE